MEVSWILDKIDLDVMILMKDGEEQIWSFISRLSKDLILAHETCVLICPFSCYTLVGLRRMDAYKLHISRRQVVLFGNLKTANELSEQHQLLIIL